MTNESLIVDNKISTLVYIESFYSFKLFGEDYNTQLNDFQVLSVSQLVCNLNTIENYWDSIKIQALCNPILFDKILPSLPFTFDQLDSNHKIWFRDNKLNKILNEKDS